MEGAMRETPRVRGVEPISQLHDERQRVFNRGWGVVPNRDVQRLGGDVFCRQIRNVVRQPTTERGDERRV